MSEIHNTHAPARRGPKWPVKAMVTCALLTAISVVLARFLIPTPNEVTRFSLEAVPIFLAGMLFGPLPGALTGFAADFIGVLANAVEGTELVDPLGRKAVAYAGHTGNIVGGFASE